MKQRIAVLNPTCLEVVEEHRAWIDGLGARGVELAAQQQWRHLRPEQVEEAAGGAQAIILPAPSLGREELNTLLGRCAALQALSIAASGYDWLDVEEATRQGLVVTRALPPVGTEVVADLTWGLLLGVARQIPAHHQQVQAGNYARGTGLSAWGKTLGIVGLGRIGRAVARRAAGFEMQVLAATPHPDAAWVAAQRIEVVELDELLRRSDFVSLHARLNPQTRGLIGGRELGLMKREAILINAARRELVDEAALEAALVEGRLGGAGLDDPPVRPDTPLLGLPNVIFTPHLGNRAREGMHAVFCCAVENAIAVLEGRRPAWVVNPQVYELPAEQQRFKVPI